MSCLPPPSPSRAAGDRVPLGAPFDIRIGGTALVSSDDLRIWFESVKNDSRCPRGAQCITEGDATLVISAGLPFRERERLELHVVGAQNRVAYDDFDIRVERLAPQPEQGTGVPPDEYTATLTVTKR
jgi:hypothetical protein